MANIFLKKTMASMLNMPSDQVDAILKAAEAFSNNEIPKEINQMLKFVDDNF